MAAKTYFEWEQRKKLFDNLSSFSRNGISCERNCKKCFATNSSWFVMSFLFVTECLMFCGVVSIPKAILIALNKILNWMDTVKNMNQFLRKKKTVSLTYFPILLSWPVIATATKMYFNSVKFSHFTINTKSDGGHPQKKIICILGNHKTIQLMDFFFVRSASNICI